jgi:ABC-type uncharacterized transport system permease subunit
VRKRVLGFIVALAAIAASLYGLELIGLSSAMLIATTSFTMTPLAFAAVGECINEKAGIINIGLEGILLITSFAGVFGARRLENWAGGLGFGLLVGTLIGLLFGVICVYGLADQIVAGMGINILATGIIPYLLMAVYAFPGLHILPGELMVPRTYTPLGWVSPLTFVAIIAAVMTYVLLNKTLLGIRIRAAGEKPEALDVAGVRVDRMRIFTSAFGGALCGLGGAFMSLAWFGAITKGMVAGRGFIALAVVVCAGLNPLWALATSFIFGFSEALASTVAITPGVKEVIPHYFIYMIPYLLTLVVFAIAIAKRRFPQASGKPYVRE